MQSTTPPSSSICSEPSTTLTSPLASSFMCNFCRLPMGSAQELRNHIDNLHVVYNNGWTTGTTVSNVNKCQDCGCFRPVTVLCSVNPFRCEACTFQQQVITGHKHHQPQQLTMQYPFQPQQQQQQSHSHPESVIIPIDCALKKQTDGKDYPPNDKTTSTKPISSPIRNIRSSNPTPITVASTLTDQPKAYQCPDCPKSFAHANTLTMHRKLHAGDFKYMCEYCNKPFVLQDYYMRHLRVHTKEKPYTCDLCDKRFSQSNTLTQHRRTHTGEKPYACDECGKQFGVRDYLNKHRRTHTGEKPYGCGVCGKQYSQPSALRSHQKQHAHLPAGGTDRSDNAID